MKGIIYWAVVIIVYIAFLLTFKDIGFARFVTIICAIGYCYTDLYEKDDKK